jgi:hypothetical protein
MKIKNTAIGAAALALGAVAVAGPALATGSTYAVSVGGSSAAGTHNITASAGAISFAVPLVTMSCTSANVPASPASTVTSGPSVTDIAAINQVNFGGCTGPGGSLTVTTSGSWTLHGTGAATSGSSDVVAGHIENITARVFNAACDFTVTGTARGSFDEATQKLTINEPGGTGGQLKVTSVSASKPCLSKVKVNDIASFNGVFTVAGGPILLG